MDKNEMSLIMDEFKTAMNNRDFDQAVELADQLDLKKIKDNSFLSLVADAYELTHNYKQAKDVLLQAYENTNAGRHLAYRLCLISIKTKEFDEAEEYYEDLVEMAPRDTSRYILKYRMAKAKGEPIEKLIEILEQYVNIDMEEKWAYELAKLYHMAGEEEKCVDMCDEICLWFADGKYVNKAMKLKQMHRPLSSTQQQQFDENKKKEAAKREKPLKTLGGKQLMPDAEKLTADGEKKATSNTKEAISKNTDASDDNVSDKPAGDHISKKVKPVSDHEVTEIKFDNVEEVEADVKAAIVENSEAVTSTEPGNTEASVKSDEDEINSEPDKAGSNTKSDKNAAKPLTDVKGVEEMLRQLQERGILKAETVNQAVSIMEDNNKDVKEREETKRKDPSDMLTRKREVQSRKAEERTKNNRGIKLNVVEPPKHEDVEEVKPVEKVEPKPIEEESVEKVEPEPIKEETVEKVEPEPIKEETVEKVEPEPIKEEPVEKVEPEPIKEEPVEKVEPEPINEEPAEEIEATKRFDVESIKEVIKEERNNTKAREEAEKKEEPEGVVEMGEMDEVDLKEISDKNKTVPVFDLLFDQPERDSSKDIGRENMYQDIVVNSDMGRNTDRLPDKEEIEEAIKQAEQAMNVEPEEESEATQSEEKVSDQLDTGIRSDKDLSAKVEIISGTDWKQPDVAAEKAAAEKAAEKAAAEKAAAEKAATEKAAAEKAAAEKAAAEKAAAEKAAEKAAAEKEEAPVEEPEQKAEENAKNSQQEEASSLPNTEFTLTAEEMDVFKNYFNVEGFEENIENIFKDMVVDYEPNGKSDNCNIVIIGGKKTGKTTLGIELIKLINKKRGRRDRKLAKVKAEALNRRGFRNSLNKLLGCDLIVEESQELGPMTLSEIVDASGMFTDDMLIVLEGETEGMEKILKDTPRVSTVFDHVIRIKEYNLQEWVDYGVKYASTKGYALDELAKLAFYKDVDDFFGTHQGIEQEDVENIVDEAIAKSNKIGRKLTGIFGAKKDEDGLNILVESDFNV